MKQYSLDDQLKLISRGVEEIIPEDTMSDIDQEMVYGTKQNILNAIENAVVQTIVAFAEVAEEN